MEAQNVGTATKQPVAFMNTLTACVNKMAKNGYTDNLTITKQGLYSTDKDKVYGPQDIKVIDFYRFEGQSDPADNAIMYVIETADGVKGMIIDAYGHYADDSVTRFMKHVEEVNKNVEKVDKSA
ncbi:MAG: hypothetical protein H7257_01180 [Taibaiella sp.]|nr:hypothetical protein [Taibaiella sp.]